jgi:hypothetical protein
MRTAGPSCHHNISIQRQEIECNHQQPIRKLLPSASPYVSCDWLFQEPGTSFLTNQEKPFLGLMLQPGGSNGGFLAAGKVSQRGGVVRASAPITFDLHANEDLAPITADLYANEDCWHQSQLTSMQMKTVGTNHS